MLLTPAAQAESDPILAFSAEVSASKKEDAVSIPAEPLSNPIGSLHSGKVFKK